MNWKASIRFGGMRLLGMRRMSSWEEERMYAFFKSLARKGWPDKGFWLQSGCHWHEGAEREGDVGELKKTNWWHSRREGLDPEGWAKGVGRRYAHRGTRWGNGILSVSLLIENKGIEEKGVGRYRRTTKGKGKWGGLGGSVQWCWGPRAGRRPGVSYSLEEWFSLEMPCACPSEGRWWVHTRRISCGKIRLSLPPFELSTSLLISKSSVLYILVSSPLTFPHMSPCPYGYQT